MVRKKKNINAQQGSVNKELNDKKLKPEDQQEHERGSTSSKTKEPSELFGTEATLRNTQIQEHSPDKQRSVKKKKVTKNLYRSGSSNNDQTESPSVDVTSRENKKLVKSVANSVTTTQDEPDVSASGGESFYFISDRLQDFDLEEHSVAPDRGTMDASKRVGTTGKLSDQGEAKIFAAVNDVGTKVMQAVFQTIFFAREIKCQEEDTVVTLDKWFDKYEISKNMIKEILGRQYCKNLTDPLTTKYDIQFYMFAFDLYKLKNCSHLLEGFKDHLDKVKYYRDKLCHRGLLYTCEKATLNSLEKVYVDTLKMVATKFDNKTYTQPVLKSIPKLMAHLKKNDQDLSTFGKVKDKFLSERRPKFINEAQKELAKNVNRNFTNPFYWIHEDMSMDFKFALNDVYCNPWLVGGDERLEVSKLLLFPERGVPPQVLILVGDGATGKTTLCHKMLSQWQEKHEKEPTFLRLKHFDLVLLLELRNINDISLVEYLKHNLLANTIEKTIYPGDLLELLQDLDVLYIIDGFDEKDEGGRNVKLVKDITKNLSNKSRVLLTTRAEYQKDAENLFSSVSTDDHLDLRGLDPKGQIELSFNLINVLRESEDCKELHEQFGHFLKDRGNVFMDRLRIPLIMDLLVLLWLESKDDDSILKEIKSATQLYQHLVTMLKGKLAERLEKAFGREAISYDSSKHGEQSETDSSKEVKAFPTHSVYLDECSIANRLDQMIMILSKVAYRHTLADVIDLKLDQNDLCRLKESCAKKIIKDKQFFSAFLIHDVRAEPPHFSFFHRTETDYFSAVFITEEAKVKKCFDIRSYFSERREMKKHKDTILFLVGCFSIDNVLNRYSSQIMEMVELAQVDRYNFNFYFKLLVESGSGKGHKLDSDGCKEPLCSRVAEYLPLQLWNLKDDTAIAGLRILMHCFHVKISELEIDFAQQVDPDSDENLVNFSDVMERLKWALKRRFCKEKRNEIVLSLHIRHHALGDGTSTSDRYLSYLHPWAKLTKFTGHIGVEASQHLFYCTNLKDLDIRITSVTAYNKFMENCFPRYSRLKKMTMRLCFSPGTVDVPSLLPFPDQGPKSVRTAVRLHFKKVRKMSFDKIINIILQITGRQDGVLERVVINSSDLDLVSAETIFEQLQSIVCEKVSVSSNTELRDDKLTNFLGVPSSFIFEWNDRNISEELVESARESWIGSC